MNHDLRLDEHPADEGYIACWDGVHFYECPTCGMPAEQRCVTTSGNELSITRSHLPRVALAAATIQCIARNPRQGGRCQRMTRQSNNLCYLHQEWKP